MMSEQRPFDSFIDLISFDQKLHLNEVAIQKKEQEIAQLQEQKRLLDTELHAAKIELHDARKLVDEKELEMKDLEAQEKDKKKRMDQVSTQKEYQSLKHELATIAGQQLALEDVLIAAWNQREVAQKKFETFEMTLEQKVSKINDEIGQVKSELEKITDQLTEQKKMRSTKEKPVPEEWLEKYMVMRSRVIDPVVAVVDGSCGACFHQLTDQDLIMINRNKLLQCKGCYRFLYNASLDQRAES